MAMSATRPAPSNLGAVLSMISQMEADGVVDRYALGGAVGATFYLEPVATLDVDLAHHNLSDRWQQSQRQFPSDGP